MVAKGVLCILAVAARAAAEGQNQTAQELWPELDVFLKISQTVRLEFVGSSTRDQDTSYFDHSVGVYADIYVPRFKPVVFRRISELDDSRTQRINVRVGYRYDQSFRQTPAIVEHRPFVDATWRWALPLDMLASNRNRFEFRTKNGVYSWRYRNEFKLERDLMVIGQPITPYVSAEAFYDSSPGAWNRFRYKAGTVVPAGKYLAIDAYYARQTTEYAQTRNLNAFGFTINVYINY